jgi:hypothetical protein
VGGVFINYRAKDNPLGAAGIHDLLARRFGYDLVFRDCVSMRPGEHYPSEMRTALKQADVLVAVIGPRWNTIGGEDGDIPCIRREKDWVRWEIATALTLAIPIVPVLLTDLAEPTDLPDRRILPGDILDFANRQAFELSQKRFGADVDRLVARLVELAPTLAGPRAFGSAAGETRQTVVPRTADSAPSTLLRAEYRVVDFDGRGGHLDDLRSWATNAGACPVRLVAGPAGAGKTRLAVELCAALNNAGWLAGMLVDNASAGRINEAGTPILLVADDASMRVGQLAALAVAFADRTDKGGQVKLLLTDRTAGNWLAELCRHSDQRVAAFFRAMTSADTVTLDAGTTDPHGQYIAAFTAFASKIGATGTPRPIGLDACRSRLDIHATALDNALGAAGRGTETVHHDGRPLVRILRQDRAHRRLLSKKDGGDDYDPASLDAIATVATLCHLGTEEQAAAVRSRLANFVGDDRRPVTDYVALLDRIYPGRCSLTAVRPTGLGEELVSATLAEQPSIATTLAATGTDEQLTTALTVLGNAVADHPHLRTVITDMLGVDPERLIPIALAVASRVRNPEDFARLVGTSVNDNKIGPDGIFRLMDQLGREARNRSTDPLRAATLRALIEQFALPLVEDMQKRTTTTSPATEPLKNVTYKLNNLLLDTATSILDPGSGRMPTNPTGQPLLPPEMVQALRMVMDWRAQENGDEQQRP